LPALPLEEGPVASMKSRFKYHSLTLQAMPGAVEEAARWLEELSEQQGLIGDKRLSLNRCVQELISSIRIHAFGGGAGEISLGVLLDQDSVALTLVDAGRPFDPLLDSPSLLQLADQFLYERVGEKNRMIVRIGCQSAPCSADFVSLAALFGDVSCSNLAPIFACCEVRDAAVGEMIFEAGEYYNCVLVVMDGRLEVRLDGPDSNNCIELGAGECVGELSVADGKPASAWIGAAVPTRLLVVPEPVFLGSVLGVPAIARNLIVLLSERMRRSNDQMIARMREMLEFESMKRELNVARQIQTGMLPAAPLFANIPGIEGRGFMRAAQQVGGDFYDAFQVSDGRFFVTIGDVCNKGTSAALYMMRTLTILRNEAMHPFADIDEHLARVASRTNDLLNQANEAQQFVTVFLAIIDLQEGRLHYVNAGHNPPVLRLPDVAPVYLKGVRSPLFGLMSDLDYKANRCEFPAGCLLLLYTDGVTEAVSASGAMFGEAALLEKLGDTNLEVEACIDQVVSAVDDFVGEYSQSDDITLLALGRPKVLHA